MLYACTCVCYVYLYPYASKLAWDQMNEYLLKSMNKIFCKISVFGENIK